MFTLITAASTAQAYQLKNILNDKDILLGDYLDMPEFMVKSGKMIKLPHPAASAYPHEILALCLDKNINSIFPLRPEEAESLKPAQQLFNEYEISINFTGDEV